MGYEVKRVIGSVAVVGPLTRIENSEKIFIEKNKKTGYLISSGMRCDTEILKRYSIF